MISSRCKSSVVAATLLLAGLSVPAHAQNAAPTLSGQPTLVGYVGVGYSFTPTAADADGDRLRFSARNLPAWANFNGSSGKFSGTPATSGTAHGILISVNDGTTTTTLPAFDVTVRGNAAPTINGTAPTTAVGGQLYSFTPTATEPEGQSIRFSITGKPSWTYFSWRTGRLYGRPPSGGSGSYSNIVISVSDGTNSSSLPAFAIRVRAAGTNTAPTIIGMPPTQVTAEQPYAFQPTAADADEDSLTFSVTGIPVWATFSQLTGRIAGTPPATVAGIHGPVTISVSDGRAIVALPAFSIRVAAKPNTAPTISGVPATQVSAGQQYVFQPSAHDPDGQALRFGIANKPAWADFDIGSGRLSGTPPMVGAAACANIVISVSDGTASATLASFAITVNVVGSAELSWTAPTQNDDGSALTDLAGYKIRYGTSPDAMNQAVTVPGPAITMAAIEGLDAGTWYFTVAAYTHTNVESEQSAAVSKIVM